MSQKNIERFVQFLLNNKNMDRNHRQEVSRLLIRDAAYINKNDAEESSIPEQYTFHTEIADTETIYRFLHLFGQKEALKYTTHTWERSSETGKFIYEDFDTFKSQYTSILNDWERKINLIGNTDLWMLIRNFLLNDDATFFWGEDRIRVGFNKFLSKWMKENPDNQPFSMPLSEFPAEIRPLVVNKRCLSSFNDVVEVFKHCIEFRDNDLYSAVKRIFKNKSFSLNKDKLSTLQGVTFYTHTQKVKAALEIISGNIFNRTDFPEVEISCETFEEAKRNAIRITILQVGSFSNKDLASSKVLAQDPDGDIATIKTYLRNLCDFSVESLFKQNGEIKPIRINYTKSDKTQSQAFEAIPSKDCRGFAYILTFYNYNS